MKKFKPSLLTLSLMAAGLSLHTIPSYAQQTDAQQAPATEEDEIEKIQVKGFRSSLIKSLNTKRFSDTVVDGISADDIGGLPDVSIADALARIPGVTSVRIDGQSSELNIRGLSGGFVFSTLNGRELVSTSGGRSVQFDQFPSELIQQAQIYKSQKASLIEGGVAGTVELETVNALDLDEESKLRISVQGSHNSDASDNPDASDYGSRFTISYQRKFLDETLGVALGYSRQDEATISSRFVNYAPQSTSTDAYEGFPDDFFMSNGFEINQRAGDVERDSIVVSVNWVPTDDIRIKWDLLNSEVDSVEFDRGILVGESDSGTLRFLGLDGNDTFPFSLQDPQIINNYLVGGTFIRDPDGTFPAPPFPGSFSSCNCLSPQIQNDNASTFSETLATGINLEWDITDNFSASFDVSYSEAEETSLDEVFRMVLFEDASAETPIVDDNIVLNYQLNGIAIPTISFNESYDFTDLNKVMPASYERYPRIEENSAEAFRADFKYELDNDWVSSIEFGTRFSKREYELERGVYRYGKSNEKAMRSGDYITYGRDDEGNLIEVSRASPFQLSEDDISVVNFGGELSGMPAFISVNNVSDVVSQWINEDTTALRRWGSSATSWSMTDGSSVEEEVTSAYLQANLDMEIGGFPVTGNVGLRVIDTEQSSIGLVFVGEGAGVEICDDVMFCRDDYIRTEIGDDYTNTLPSFNLNVQLTDQQQLRFAYAKVLSRADLPDMRNTGSWDFNPFGQGPNGESVGTISLDSGGNPAIRPFEADQIDISYEYYFSETDGAFTVALWNKDITNFNETIETPFFDFESAGITPPPVPEELRVDEATGEEITYINGDYNRPVNLDDPGYMRGVEIAYQQTFSFLPDIWSGLGVNLSFSYTESDLTIDSEISGADEDDTVTFPFLSRRVWSGTVYYDGPDEKFSARINARYRSPYVGEQIAIGQDEQALFEEELIVSAQASYNINENLQIFISGDNLTDEPNRTYFGSRERTGTLQYFGKTYYLGFNYNL